MMDIGTILLITAVAVGALDAIILILGPRIEEYEKYSFITSAVSFIAALGAITWLGFLIFTNQFQYAYVNQVTNIESSIMLKTSALWAGQSGSLVFWTVLSFGLYFGFRIVTRGYEDDKLVYRSAIIMVVESAIIAVNALVANPFRLVEGPVPTDGMGLNPLLSTFWNVIHPPIVFIAYALILIPFAVKLAGFTMTSEERTTDPIPVVSAYTRLSTVMAWLFLSGGIVIGAYWAYIVLGWGGYWAWDPVETTSLIPWLLLTAFYHAKPTLNKNDVLRDSFLVMSYISVILATWVTRSGVLTSVHGFGLSLVSWTMLASLLFNLVLGVGLTSYAGFKEMKDEEQSSGPGFFDYKNVRLFSIKMALIGLIIIAANSTMGVALPAVYNLGVAILDPGNLNDRMIGVDIEFFRMGFYLASIFIIVSAFYCMRSKFLTHRNRGIIIISLLAIGVVLTALSSFGGFGPLPTNYAPANFLIPIAMGAVAFLVIAFARHMLGRESKILTMRQMGRLMLHLGLIILLLGVFMSENIVYETNAGYLNNGINEIAPGIYVRVSDIDLEYFNHERDFNMIVTVQVIENDMIVGIGYATVTGHPAWGMVSHMVYIHTTLFRDVLVAVTAFNTIAGGVLQVTIHTKILPLASFVWLGPFLMIAAMIPMFALEFESLRRALKTKEKHLYADEDTDAVQALPDQQ